MYISDISHKLSILTVKLLTTSLEFHSKNLDDMCKKSCDDYRSSGAGSKRVTLNAPQSQRNVVETITHGRWGSLGWYCEHSAASQLATNNKFYELFATFIQNGNAFFKNNRTTVTAED